MHFTSGTTGRSKGVWSGPISEDAARRYWADEHAQWQVEPDDVVLNHGPLAHSAPLRFSMLAFLHGASVVYTGAFDANRIADAIARYRPSVAMAVPTHLQRLLDLPGGGPRSRPTGCSSTPDRRARPTSSAGSTRGPASTTSGEFLGASEGQFSACTGAEWEQRPGTLGRARSGRTLSIAPLAEGDGAATEAGVIWCSAPDFAAFEYFGDPVKTARPGAATTPVARSPSATWDGSTRTATCTCTDAAPT